MAAGEYVSVSSQSDTERSDLNREREELTMDGKNEHAELAAIYVARGLTPELARQVATQLMIGCARSRPVGHFRHIERETGAGRLRVRGSFQTFTKLTHRRRKYENVLFPPIRSAFVTARLQHHAARSEQFFKIGSPAVLLCQISEAVRQPFPRASPRVQLVAIVLAISHTAIASQRFNSKLLNVLKPAASNAPVITDPHRSKTSSQARPIQKCKERPPFRKEPLISCITPWRDLPSAGSCPT